MAGCIFRLTLIEKLYYVGLNMLIEYYVEAIALVEEIPDGYAEMFPLETIDIMWEEYLTE